MKKTLLVLLCAVTILAGACKKDKKEIPEQPSPAIGFWQGLYSTNGQLGNSNYAMLIKTGGLARVYDLKNETDTSELAPISKVDAVWTLTGNTLQTSYKSGTKNVNTTATLNAAYTLMTGTWSFDGLVKGNITLSK